MKDDYQSTLFMKKEAICNVIMTQGINLGGGGGITIGINEK